MGYPLDVAAQNAILDSILGDDAGATMPASFEVALFTDHPLLGGTELTSDGGYARVVVANTSANFPAAVDGAKESVAISLGTSSGPFSDTALFAELIDAADSTTRYFVVRLGEEVDVNEAGTAVTVRLTIFWNTESL